MNPTHRTLALTVLGATLLGFVSCHAPGTPSVSEAPSDDSRSLTAPVELDLPEKQDPARDEDRRLRAELRAFYTAPPLVPHFGASGMSSVVCLKCHNQAGTLTPHPQFANCTQCHVATEFPFGEAPELPENDFEGLVSPRSVEPAAAETPPPMPHRLDLRENCIACHDPESAYESLHTPHPERVNCEQCHVPLPGMEFAR